MLYIAIGPRTMKFGLWFPPFHDKTAEGWGTPLFW